MIPARRLHIGIDARNASNPRPGGFRTYILGLINGIRSLASPHRCDLYFDRPCTIAPIGVDGTTTVVNGGSRLVQENWTLPRRMQADGIDVALFPGNVSPVLAPGCARVVTLHDAIQLQSLRKVLKESKGIRQSFVNLYFAASAPRSARSADAVITVSEHARRQISKSLQIPLDRIHVAYNGVDRNVFYPEDRAAATATVREKYGLSAEYLLAIGSSDRRKNVAAVLKSYAGLPADLRERHALVVVLANSHLRLELESLAMALGVRNRMTFLSQLAPSELAPVYNAAIAYASPSMYESCPLTVLEALACGVPLVVSNTTSFPEIVGPAALMVDPESIMELSDALERVLRNDGLRAELRQRGFERSPMFDWDEAGRRAITVFELAHESYQRSSRSQARSR